ncbi:MAG: hypothetical protein CMP22_04470 [Rickettsiales bacterium]|nr:hypothetical protein [Rickettsiales bacterium]|tara:strand:- start:264 stop:452 length:189 start_codon:yes stop_codon:yes gene_type:complete
MVYIAAFIGFILGFVVGLILNRFLLADMTPQEIIENRNIKIQYGLLNWAIAMLGALIATFFV